MNPENPEKCWRCETELRYNESVDNNDGLCNLCYFEDECSRDQKY